MRLLGFLALSLALFASPPVRADGPRVLIVDTAQADAFAEAMGRFRGSLSAQVPEVTFDSRRVASKDDIAKVVGEIQASKPALVVAVGSGVLEELKKTIKDVPILFTMAGIGDVEAMEASRRAGSANIAGVTIFVPPAEQLRIMAQAIPGLKRIGVIYTQKKSSMQVEALRREAAKVGIELVEQPVEKQEDVSAAVEKVLPACDAYLQIPDIVMKNKSPLEIVITRAMALRKPTVGPELRFPENGWYLGIYCDLSAVADQSARIAAEILKGRAPAEIPIETPMAPAYALNEQCSDQIGLVIPEAARNGAARIFRNK